MAAYGWIYANAKIRGDGGDYLVRHCSPGLEKYKGMLTAISRDMLATTKRYGQAGRQECWLFGCLGQGRRPLVAMAGEQESILGTPLAGGGFRKQYCVLAWGLEGEEANFCPRDSRIFEPLKDILREIQGVGKGAAAQAQGMESAETGTTLDFRNGPGAAGMSRPLEEDGRGAGWQAQNLQAQETREEGERQEAWEAHERQETWEFLEAQKALDICDRHGMPCNIVRSGLQDEALWERCLRAKPPRPVMTGILGVEEAKKLLDFFPEGIVAVAGDMEPQYYSAAPHSAGKSGMRKQGKPKSGSQEERMCIGPDGSVILSAKWTQDSGRQAKPEDGKEKGEEILDGRRKKEGPSPGASAYTAGEKSRRRSQKADKKQAFVKEKEEKERRQIIECAERCRKELEQELLAAIGEAVGRMQLSPGFSNQIKAFGCMYLWRSRYLGQKTIKTRNEIFHFLETWRQEVKNKNGAIQANKIVASEVAGLMERRR